MTNLANGYHSLHRYEDALKLREETLELFKAKYGPDDSDTLMAAHNIAANLRALGRYADALRLDEETRSRRTTTLGVDHPDTLTSLWSVAQDLIKLDRGADAIPLLDECLQRAVGKRVHRNFPEVADLRLRYFEKAKERRGMPHDRRVVGEARSAPTRKACTRPPFAEPSPPRCSKKRMLTPILTGSPRTRPTGPWPGLTRPSPQDSTIRISWQRARNSTRCAIAPSSAS